MSLPALTPAMVAAASSNPPLHEFLLTQAQQQCTYHSTQLAYWQSIQSQLTLDGSIMTAGVQPYPSINPSMSPRTTHVNPKASFRDGLASVIGKAKPSIDEEFSPASSPSPKFAHADRPKMKRPTSRTKQTAPFVMSPSNNQSGNQSNDDTELKFSANPLPPIPSTSRSGTSSPQGSEPASPNHANITAAASRRPPPLPPSQQGSRNNSRSQSPSRSSNQSNHQPTNQLNTELKQSPVHASSVAPVHVEQEDDIPPAVVTPASTAARFGGIKMPIVGDPSVELKARLQKRADGTVPPPLLKAQSAAPTISVEATATADCGQCGCKDFKQDAFKKSKCSNCFHVH